MPSIHLPSQIRNAGISFMVSEIIRLSATDRPIKDFLVQIRLKGGLRNEDASQDERLLTELLSSNFRAELFFPRKHIPMPEPLYPAIDD